jgi:hypothetical protein
MVFKFCCWLPLNLDGLFFLSNSSSQGLVYLESVALKLLFFLGSRRCRESFLQPRIY